MLVWILGLTRKDQHNDRRDNKADPEQFHGIGLFFKENYRSDEGKYQFDLANRTYEGGVLQGKSREPPD